MPGEHSTVSIQSLISYPLAKSLLPALHSLHISPNQITLFNICLRCCIAVKYFKEKPNNTFLGLLLFSNFLDCLDGALARKYNQESEFGALLDSISDKIFWSILTSAALFSCHSNNHSSVPLLGSMAAGAIAVQVLCLHYNQCNIANFLDMHSDIIVIFIWYLLTKVCAE